MSGFLPLGINLPHIDIFDKPDFKLPGFNKPEPDNPYHPQKQNDSNTGPQISEKKKEGGGSEHTKGKDPSKKDKHEAGQARKDQDKKGGEKGDARRKK